MGKGAPNAVGAVDDSAAAATTPPKVGTSNKSEWNAAVVDSKPAPVSPVEKTTLKSTQPTSHAAFASQPTNQQQITPKSTPTANSSIKPHIASHPKVSPQQTHHVQSSSNAASSPSAVTPQNESAIVNGHSVQQTSQANNGNSGNRRVPKSKWVPLEIELPKARGGKPPRERNNNVSGTTSTTSANPIRRRDPDADAEYYASEREHREPREHREAREPREPRDNRDSRDSRDSRNPRPYRATSYRGGSSATRTRPPVHSTSTRTSHPHNTAPSTRPSGISSSTIGGHPKRVAPIRTVSGGGGIQKTRPPRTINQHQHQNGEFATAEFPVDFSLVKKIVSSGGAGIEAPQFLMPYLGTYYYNGVPSYANMDTSSLKEAIRKQV